MYVTQNLEDPRGYAETGGIDWFRMISVSSSCGHSGGQLELEFGGLNKIVVYEGITYACLL